MTTPWRGYFPLNKAAPPEDTCWLCDTPIFDPVRANRLVVQNSRGELVPQMVCPSCFKGHKT